MGTPLTLVILNWINESAFENSVQSIYSVISYSFADIKDEIVEPCDGDDPRCRDDDGLLLVLRLPISDRLQPVSISIILNVLNSFRNVELRDDSGSCAWVNDDDNEWIFD